MASQKPNEQDALGVFQTTNSRGQVTGAEATRHSNPRIGGASGAKGTASTPFSTSDGRPQEALRALKSIPGAGQYIHPVLEVADLLSPDDHEPKTSAKASAGREPSSEDDSRSSNTHDSERARRAAGTLVPSVDPKASSCAPFGDTNVSVDDAAARCVVVAKGPLVLTDAQTTGTCGNDLLIGAGTPGRPRWALVSTASAPLNVHGANFGVMNDEALFVVQMAPSAAALRGDLHCSITWAATAR